MISEFYDILWILHFLHFCRFTSSVPCTAGHHTKVRSMQASDSRTSQVDLLAAREILVVHLESNLSVQKSVPHSREIVLAFFLHLNIFKSILMTFPFAIEINSLCKFAFRKTCCRKGVVRERKGLMKANSCKLGSNDATGELGCRTSILCFRLCNTQTGET